MAFTKWKWLLLVCFIGSNHSKIHAVPQADSLSCQGIFKAAAAPVKKSFDGRDFGGGQGSQRSKHDKIENKQDLLDKIGDLCLGCTQKEPSSSDNDPSKL